MERTLFEEAALRAMQGLLSKDTKFAEINPITLAIESCKYAKALVDQINFLYPKALRCDDQIIPTSSPLESHIKGTKSIYRESVEPLGLVNPANISAPETPPIKEKTKKKDNVLSN